MQQYWARGHRQVAVLRLRSGFTLVELLVVIVILAILAAIVVFAVQNMTTQSAVASCQSDFNTVETATETFKAQTGAYPGGAYSSGITPMPATGTAPRDQLGILDLLGTATTETGAVGPWLKDYPYNNDHYQIEVSTDGKGTVSVWGTGASPSQIGSADTETDCTNVK